MIATKTIWGGLGVTASVVAGLLLFVSTGCDSGGSGGSGSYSPPTAITVHWPNLRGPNGVGRVTDTTPNYPTNWDYSTGTNIVWRSPVPNRGVSSPVVADGRVFLTGATPTSREVYCYNASNGTLMWTRTVTPVGSMTQAENYYDYMYAAPTPAMDGVNVYALFSNGDLACIDYNGTVVWAKSLGDPGVYYGHSSSLIVYEDFLIVQLDECKDVGGTVPSRLLGINTSTGAIAWEHGNPDRASTWGYSTPIIINDGSMDLVITTGKTDVIANDPTDGSEVWRFSTGADCAYVSPTAANGSVFAVKGTAEIHSVSDAGVGESSNIAGLAPEYSSPAAALIAGEGTLVFSIRGSVSGAYVMCFDADNAMTQVWGTQMLFAGNVPIYASPIVVGNKVYMLSGDGVCKVLNASKTYSVVDTGTLEPNAPGATSGYWATPAFAENRIYIRSQDHLTCIGN